MICAIMQPAFFPYLGFFDLIDSVDRFVFLDNVKLVKSYWPVRNRIKTDQKELFITVPVGTPKGRSNTMINEAVIDLHDSWKKKHLRSIYFSYKKAIFFNEVYPFIEELYQLKLSNLSDFNITVITTICSKIGLNKKMYRSSELEGIQGVKDGRLVRICQALNCQEYLSPQGSIPYLEKDSPGGELSKNGITVFYQNYQHPLYPQCHGDFISHLSCIDLLFNCGFPRSLEKIREGHQAPILCSAIKNRLE
jgi:hypothetical protein